MSKKFYKLYIFLFGVLVGFFVFYCISDSPKDRNELRIGSSTDQLTNPLLECDLGEEYISKNSIKPFKNLIENKISDLKNRDMVGYVSYYFRDLNNGSTFGINEKEKFFPASLLKVPLLLYTLERASEDPGLLNREIEYVGKSLTEIQYTQPEDPIRPNGTYTVKQLLEKMIIESDNNAAVLVYKYLGEEQFRNMFSNFSLEVPIDSESYNINVKDYASFFRILFNASYLPNKFSQAALSLLSQVKFRAGIVAGVPENVIVAHKFGEIEYLNQKQFHDCGIVYYPKSPYLLCVMTRGSDYEKLISSIAEISKTTFEEVQKQKISK